MNPVMGVGACVFFFCFPAGLIMVSLGLFRRGGMECSACGYQRIGLPAGAVCPECGASAAAAREREILRKEWQVWVGGCLLAVSMVPLVILLGIMAAAAL